MLLYRNLTTYDFIVQEQKRLRERDALKRAAKIAKKDQARGEYKGTAVNTDEEDPRERDIELSNSIQGVISR